VKPLIWNLPLVAKRAGRSLAAALVIGGTLAGYNFVAPGDNTVEAASNSIYWGAYVDGAPYSAAVTDKFEADAGKKQSIVHWGQPWMMNSTHKYQAFQTSQYESVRLRGAIPMVDWGSWSLGAGATVQTDYQLADIYNGAHDAYITQWATAAKAWGHPFFLRFDHEMNGNWFSWSERVNGNQPGDFVKAWRHVHDIFQRVGATNVTWLWCPNLVSPTSTPLAEMYPGDAYVDWTGMDGYNWGTDHSNKWYAFNQVFGMNPWTKHSTYDDIVALAPNKPMAIAEIATSKDGGDPAAWIKDTLTTQLPVNFPQVKALVWFNWNAGDPTLEWPIESTPAMQSAFKTGIASSYYASNNYSVLPQGPIQPPGGAPVATPTATSTPATLTPTPTATRPATLTPTPTATHPATFTPTATATRPATFTPTATRVPVTVTPTATATRPATLTPIATATATSVPITATPVVPTPTAGLPVGPGTVTLASDRDSYTSAAAPDSAAGGASSMLVTSRAGSGSAFVRFNMTSLAGRTITGVSLRIQTATDGSSVVQSVKHVGSDVWSEQYMSFNNSIPLSSIGLPLTTFLAPAAGTWYTVALPAAAVQGDAGTYASFAIDSTSVDALNFYARESGAAGPQLVVSYQ
jgi:hypothetical protein